MPMRLVYVNMASKALLQALVAGILWCIPPPCAVTTHTFPCLTLLSAIFPRTIKLHACMSPADGKIINKGRQAASLAV